MAAFHRLKDVGGQLRLAGQVGLRQGLLHPLNLHQTQRSLVTCRTHTHARVTQELAMKRSRQRQAAASLTDDHQQLLLLFDDVDLEDGS